MSQETPIQPHPFPLETPFVIELRQVPEENRAYFRQVPVLRITRALRTSGLLRILPPDLARTLLFILTFVNSQGDCLPTLHELSSAMGTGPIKTRALVGRLLRFRWQGERILREIRRESGLHAYTPTPLIVTVVVIPPPPEPEPVASSREAIIAHSREQFARPRAEVEAQIEEQWSLPVPPAVSQPLDLSSDRVLVELRHRLQLLGVSDNQMDYLLSEFLPDRIARQILWLPYRKPRNPAALVVSAIEHDYEEPFAIRESHEDSTGTAEDQSGDTDQQAPTEAPGQEAS